MKKHFKKRTFRRSSKKRFSKRKYKKSSKKLARKIKSIISRNDETKYETYTLAEEADISIFYTAAYEAGFWFGDSWSTLQEIYNLTNFVIPVGTAYN